MTHSHTSEPDWGPPGPLSSSPVVSGWTINEDLEWHSGDWWQVWHVYVLMPDGTVHELVAYTVAAAP